MNIHEYQAKELYRQYGVPTGQGFPAFTVAEAVEAAKKLPGPVWVVKSQIHAGGRGKGKFKEASAGSGGGVRLAKSVEEVEAFAGQMLGNTLVTNSGSGRAFEVTAEGKIVWEFANPKVYRDANRANIWRLTRFQGNEPGFPLDLVSKR